MNYTWYNLYMNLSSMYSDLCRQNKSIQESLKDWIYASIEPPESGHPGQFWYDTSDGTMRAYKDRNGWISIEWTLPEEEKESVFYNRAMWKAVIIGLLSLLLALSIYCIATL